jgi:hypothetical protein
MGVMCKPFLRALAISAVLVFAAANTAFAGDSKGKRVKYRTVSDSYLSSLVLPLSSVPVVGQAEVNFRSSVTSAQRRSVIGFSIPLQLPEMDIVDKESAERGKFTLEIVRDSAKVNECTFALVDVPYALRSISLSGPFLDLLVSGRYFYELQYDGDQAINGGCDAPLSQLAKGDRLFIKGEFTNSEIKDLAIGELGQITARRTFRVGRYRGGSGK